MGVSPQIPAGAFPTHTRRPEIEFSKLQAGPPGALYVADEDRLVISAWNSAASVELAVHGRFLVPGVGVVPFHETLVPATDRSVTTRAYGFGEGFLLSLTVHPEAGAPLAGQCFVQAGLGRLVAAAQTLYALAISGYATEAQFLGWPGGKLRPSLDGCGALRSVAGADPAAGVEITETVPTNARWKLHAFRASLVTSATAATRRVHLVIDDGTTTLLDLPAADTQAASLARNYDAAPFGYAPAAIVSEIYIPTPGPLKLLAGWRVRTATDSFQAGDNFGAPQLLVEEWIEE